MKAKFFMIAAVLFSTAALANGQQMPVLPNDPAAKVGKLDNGMTYYIRHNDKPAGRAEFYLATNVGALQEEPDQDGLAHFLEHMCFNGTKNFPDKGILNWLESIGASFGGNVNASTGVEQTIYLLNNIPLVRPTVIDTCLLIMHDYSHFVTCDPVEIDKERGVILEEKRSRNTASWRMREQSSPYIYGDTKYATTTIIGSEENLKNFKPESLTNFYHTWYRPDMQALVVVGDFDVDEVEAKIKSTFADIPAVENPRQKEVIRIPDNEEPVIGVLTDKENNNTSISVYWKSEPMPEEMNNTAIGMLTNVVKDLVSNIMNERFSDLSAKSEAPFLDAGFGMGKLCESCEVVLAQVDCKEGRALESFASLLSETKRMSLYGFSDSEVERAKTELLSQYERAANSADTRKNGEFVMAMIYNFLDNEPFMDPAVEYELAKELLGQINAAVLNQIAQQLITKENMVVIYTAPEREGLSHPSEAELRAVIEAVENADIARAEGEDIPAEFVNPAKIKAGKVKKSSNGLYGSTVLQLKNGLRVTLLPTEVQKDRISFSLNMKGGKSLFPDSHMASLDDNVLGLFLQNSGVGVFPNTMVGKMLAGKQLSVSPRIGNYTHGISGNSTRKDLETAFQLAYLYFTEPRFDEEEYDKGIQQIKTLLPNLYNNPQYYLQKNLYETAFEPGRMLMIDDEVLGAASLETLAADYRQMFKDVTGAELIVVGDFDINVVKPLVLKYFGSLPKAAKSVPELNVHSNDIYADGIRTVDFTTPMQVPSVIVYQIYNVKTPYSLEKNLINSVLQSILQMTYTETMREDEGGTYGAQSQAECGYIPVGLKELMIYFQTNEAQADRLRELAGEGIKSIAENGPDADKFAKAISNMLKNIPEQRETISWWQNVIKQYNETGIDINAEMEAIIKAITPADVKAVAAEYLNSGNFIEVVMRPE